jgi:hypothetical protein
MASGDNPSLVFALFRNCSIACITSGRSIWLKSLRLRLDGIGVEPVLGVIPVPVGVRVGGALLLPPVPFICAMFIVGILLLL